MARIAMILGDEFEDVEFRIPYDRLTQAGHEVTLIGKEAGETVEGKKGKEKVKIEATPQERRPQEFDALVIPGGHSPDHLRIHEDIVRFVHDFAESEKPLAAVCHGPQLLIEAGVAKGRTMTSWPSVRTDLKNAGAHWVDEQVVRDGNLITSRQPDDLNAFADALLERL